MLEICNVYAGYGDFKVLFDINLRVSEGEFVALVGSNGAGKTTLLQVISGLIPVSSGKLFWLDKDITHASPHSRPVLGIAHILQGRGILAGMSVKDNLYLGAYTKRTKQKRAQLEEKVFDLFPILKKRSNALAGSFSGGQQQMLAIARALMQEPQLLILDEPSLGLAPNLADEVFDILGNLKKSGSSILLIEQNIVKALTLADTGYVLETGKIVMKGTGAEILANTKVKKAYLGI
jgi:branched-chain amino acid transport system ATP-binding protein